MNMDLYRVTEEKVRKFVSEVRRLGYRVLGPVTQEEGRYLLDEVTSGEDLELRTGILFPSPRHYLLPPTGDVLWEAVGEDLTRIEEVRTVLEWRPTIFLGIHPCDCNAVAVLDRVYLSDPPDTHYLVRRRESVLLVFSCPEKPSEYCFCDVLGSDRPWTGTYDLWFVEYGGEYLVKCGSERGRRLLELMSAEKVRSEEYRDVLREGQGPDPELAEYVVRRLLEVMESGVWEKFSRKCLLCASCLSVCPTCYCFEICDQVLSLRPVKVVRVRRWDPCIFRSFTRIAGGRVTRESVLERFRHRFLHKFLFYWERYGFFACTGCGRCGVVCPRGLSIPEILREVTGLELPRRPVQT